MWRRFVKCHPHACYCNTHRKSAAFPLHLHLPSKWDKKCRCLWTLLQTKEFGHCHYSSKIGLKDITRRSKLHGKAREYSLKLRERMTPMEDSTRKKNIERLKNKQKRGQSQEILGLMHGFCPIQRGRHKGRWWTQKEPSAHGRPFLHLRS